MTEERYNKIKEHLGNNGYEGERLERMLKLANYAEEKCGKPEEAKRNFWSDFIEKADECQLRTTCEWNGESFADPLIRGSWNESTTSAQKIVDITHDHKSFEQALISALVAERKKNQTSPA